MTEDYQTSGLPESARLALERSGISPAGLIPALGTGPDAAVLLVGSHATGRASADSDLDFLVLLEGEEQYARPRVGDDIRMVNPLVERHYRCEHFWKREGGNGNQHRCDEVLSARAVNAAVRT